MVGTAVCRSAPVMGMAAGVAYRQPLTRVGGTGNISPRTTRCPDWRVAADIVTLFGGQACLIVIDFDGGSPEQNTAYTYSQEDLRVSADVSDGFYPIGDPDGTALLTKATIRRCPNPHLQRGDVGSKTTSTNTCQTASRRRVSYRG